ncbi:MAG: ribosome maturation factor RimP [Kineosporiaceae bacterium]
MSSVASVADRLARLLDPVVAEAGLVVEGVTVSSAGRRRVVRVVVDLPVDRLGSADLDSVADASRRVGRALDGLDGTAEAGELLGAAPYALEVSTPGVDRPLTERRHWLRARTRSVRVHRTDGSVASGRLVAVDDDGVVLDEAGAERRTAWSEVARGRVEVEFRRGTGLDEDTAAERPDAIDDPPGEAVERT